MTWKRLPDYTRPVAASFDVSYVVRMNKLLYGQSIGGDLKRHKAHAVYMCAFHITDDATWKYLSGCVTGREFNYVHYQVYLDRLLYTYFLFGN